MAEPRCDREDRVRGCQQKLTELGLPLILVEREVAVMVTAILQMEEAGRDVWTGENFFIQVVAWPDRVSIQAASHSWRIAAAAATLRTRISSSIYGTAQTTASARA